MSQAPCLVTGASGFIGRHLLNALQAHAMPRPSVALVRDPATWSAYEWTGKLEGVELLEGSVTDPRAWRDEPPVRELGGIFHLAAIVRHSRHHPEDMVRTNVEGTCNMVRLAAERGCRMVYVSTSGTVGCFDSARESADETAPYCEDAIARWPYYRSKLRAEREARRLAEELGVELVVVRPPVLLGPGDHRFRSSGNVLRFLRGRLPFVIRGGMHFADARDAARALVRAMEIERPRPAYHLPGTVCSVEEFFDLVAEVAGRPRRPPTIPFGPAHLAASAVQRIGGLFADEPPHLLPDPVVIEMAARYWDVRSRWAHDELDYAPRPGRETLADTVSWLRQNHESLRDSV